jgi:chromosome segregation ATPase
MVSRMADELQELRAKVVEQQDHVDRLEFNSQAYRSRIQLLESELDTAGPVITMSQEQWQGLDAKQQALHAIVEADRAIVSDAAQQRLADALERANVLVPSPPTMLGQKITWDDARRISKDGP